MRVFVTGPWALRFVESLCFMIKASALGHRVYRFSGGWCRSSGFAVRAEGFLPQDEDKRSLCRFQNE